VTPDGLKPCPDIGPACRIQVVECTGYEDDLHHCRPGWWPHRDAGGRCVPAGGWFPGDRTPDKWDPKNPLPDLGPPRSPPGSPKVEPLPAPEKTRFCHGPSPAEPRVCPPDADAVAGPAGQAPDAEKSGLCVPFGVANLCPPGFVVGAKGSNSDHALPPCVPDPGDCGTDPFGGIMDGAGKVFVDANATGPGIGTRQKPFSPDYSRDFVAKARFPKRIADAPGAAQRGALAVRRSEQRGRKTRGARKASLQQKES
jgi:hypothetical protein